MGFSHSRSDRVGMNGGGFQREGPTYEKKFKGPPAVAEFQFVRVPSVVCSGEEECL